MAQRNRFRAFLIARLGSEAEAEDVLQVGLLKAMRSDDGLVEDQKLMAWFYRILRNTLLDHVRSRSASIRRDHAWAMESADRDAEMERNACACLASLVSRIPPREGEMIRRVELEDQSIADAARALGITTNNAGVILHWARATLRRLLEEFCGECASGACLDCDCDEPRP